MGALPHDCVLQKPVQVTNHRNLRRQWRGGGSGGGEVCRKAPSDTIPSFFLGGRGRLVYLQIKYHLAVCSTAFSCIESLRQCLHATNGCKQHASLRLINSGNRYFTWNKLSQAVAQDPVLPGNRSRAFTISGNQMDTRWLGWHLPAISATLFSPTHATSRRRAAVPECLLSWVRNTNQRHQRRMLEFCIISLQTLNADKADVKVKNFAAVWDYFKLPKVN